MEHKDPWCWETHLNISETTELVERLSEAGSFPYEIQRADLLQSKYSEIIK
jgi:hypothetical protein